MNEVWARIESWLALNAPLVYENLAPGATQDDFAEASYQLGFDLYDGLYEFYSRHNGQLNEKPQFRDEYRLLSLKQLCRAFNTEIEMSVQPRNFGREIPRGDAVSEMFFDAGWMPVIAYNYHDYLCVDFSPGPAGVEGQIIRMPSGDLARPVIANSLLEWLTKYADALEAGQYEYSESKKSVIKRKPEE